MFFDDEGRKKYLVENLKDFDPDDESGIGGGANNDQDRVTKFTYNQLSLPKQQIALNATSSLNQITRYIYEFEMSASGCAIRRPELLRAIIFPDSADVFDDAGIWSGGFTSGTDHVSYTYYYNGARKTATDQRVVVHTYSYDYLGRLKDDAVTTCPSGVDGTVIKISRAYDNNGRLDKVTSLGASDVVRNEMEYTYNTWGAVTKSEQSHAGAVGSAPSVEYAYATAYHSGTDAKYVRLRSVTYPGPSTPNRRAVYYNYESGGEFAPLNRVASIADNDSSATETYAAYSYLGAGSVVKVEYPEVEVSSNKLAMKYWTSGSTYPGLDSMGRVVDQKWAIDTTVKDQFRYGYSGAGNRLSRDVMPDANPALTGQDNYYEYDGLDRLVKSNRGTLVSGAIDDGDAAFNQAWPGLDVLGNWTQFKWDNNGGGNSWTTQTRTHDNANQITSISGGAVSPLYDQAGSMTTGPKPDSPATPQVCTYDAWNRLMTVSEGSGTPTLIVTYSYDPPSPWRLRRAGGLNRRIRKVLAVPDPDVTYDYYYNESWQVLEVRKGGSANPYEQYVWGLQYVDAPVVRFRDHTGGEGGMPDGTVDDTLYYMYDGNFNVTALIGMNGTVAERYVYDPYGKVTFLDGSWGAISASAYDNDILFCGYWYDPETGLYHVRERYYDPITGTWKTRDRILYPDGMNLYGYVRGNPMASTDPLGRSTLQVDSSLGYGLSYNWGEVADSCKGICSATDVNYQADGPEMLEHLTNLTNQDVWVYSGHGVTLGKTDKVNAILEHNTPF